MSTKFSGKFTNKTTKIYVELEGQDRGRLKGERLDKIRSWKQEHLEGKN